MAVSKPSNTIARTRTRARAAATFCGDLSPEGIPCARPAGHTGSHAATGRDIPTLERLFQQSGRTVGGRFRARLGRPIASCYVRPPARYELKLITDCPIDSPVGVAAARAIEGGALLLRESIEAFGESSQANTIREITASVVACLVCG